MANPEITWAPTADDIAAARLTDFAAWLARDRGVDLNGYREIWQWSVDDVSGFWDALREYFDVIGEGFEGPALVDERMPGTRWYPQARVNFAENVLRFATDPEHAGRVAVTEVDETDAVRQLTWAQFGDRVAALAAQLRRLGVVPGDRVAAVLPNVPEAIIGLLAAASIGAVWSISSPDLSVDATLSRLAQLEPRVLFGVEGYRFGGRDFDRRAELAAIEAGLPTVEHTIIVDAYRTGDQVAAPRLGFDDLVAVSAEPLFERLPFDHPLWVLFSSGTTGAPKGIVHGHGGMLLEFLKSFGFNHDLASDGVYYVAANTSWMVWNTLLCALSVGAGVVCYAGSPTLGSPARQFQIIADHGVTLFATGAAYLTLVENAGVRPGDEYDLSRLRSIFSTGSPLPDSTWRWVHEAVRERVHLGSDSGGTDICSGFLGSNPLEPVRLGELQGPQLGVAAQAWSEAGERVIGDVGELVILKPMPSMPVQFWGDADGARYFDAYFAAFPGVWTHGDWITELPDGGFIVHGRSDATLNRQGVRLGSADVYSALRHVPEVLDGLVIGVEQPNGGYYMPLFVVLRDGVGLDDELRDRIAVTIRQHASARHVPDEIIVAPGMPVTHAGKKIEVQIKKLFMGVDPERALSRGALANPDTVDWYVERAAAFLAD